MKSVIAIVVVTMVATASAGLLHAHPAAVSVVRTAPVYAAPVAVAAPVAYAGGVHITHAAAPVAYAHAPVVKTVAHGPVVYSSPVVRTYAAPHAVLI